jgi:hypothetical protein
MGTFIRKGLPIMKSKILVLITLLFIGNVCLASGTASAGEAVGKITQVAAMRSKTGEVMAGMFFFEKGTHKNAPTCATETDRFAVDLTTAAGKAMYATAMAAWLTGTCVAGIGADGAGGTPNCSVWGDTETAYYIFGCPR